jgi:hypothetical protein
VRAIDDDSRNLRRPIVGNNRNNRAGGISESYGNANNRNIRSSGINSLAISGSFFYEFKSFPDRVSPWEIKQIKQKKLASYQMQLFQPFTSPLFHNDDKEKI